ncbi:MAG TPA: hypothetical protein DCZ94_20695, partial [Lentisphaeria bacterium]|nr:MAG: hypothetical protein A2X48_09155 [Lentisphaerae bacterium GWF2_49_21]HBC89366.1 hypothetical protein [Lentisphaeria bacterium]
MKPNILLIFTDQQRADTIGALGNKIIRTPALDRLCREGTAFTSAYSPSPVCVPGRCSYHYGQYPFNTKCYDNGSPMPSDKPSFMDVLKDNGYLTYGIGKCHFTPDGKAMRGFTKRETQEEIVKSPKEDDYLKFLFNNGYSHIIDPHGMRGEMYYVPQPSQISAKYHPTQWIGDRSIEFLKSHAKSRNPWMLFSSFIHPHPPFSPPASWYKMYRAPQMPLPKVPENWQDLIVFINRFQNRYKYRDRGIDINLLRCMKAFYYSCISFIDFQIGRMLDELEKSGQIDNTLIIFTSDHGELLGDYNSFGKRSMHDSCARIPLIARYPERFRKNSRCRTPASLVDVFPTILESAGISSRTFNSDGTDLAKVQELKDRKIFSHFNNAGNGLYMSLDRKWKYFYSAPDDKEFLFDRINDPEETRNILPKNRKSAAEMRDSIICELCRSGEKESVDKNGWKKYPVRKMPEDPDAGLLIQDHPWAETCQVLISI